MPVALAQSAPIVGDDPVGTYADEVRRIVAEQGQPDMVVHPEMHLFGGLDVEPDPWAWVGEVAEPLGGPRVRALAELAGDLGVWLLPGSVPERGDDGRIFNTALVLSPDGRLVASYRKVFPWRPYESWEPGDRFVTFDVPGVGRGGLTICYDAWFPESTRSVAWMGAEFVVNVVKTVGPDRRQERILAQANAITNQVVMLSVNAAGPVGTGGTIAVDANGDVLADLPGVEPGVAQLAVDLTEVERVRREGTEGLNRMWDQLGAGDASIALPVYEGRIDPRRWPPPTTEPEENL